MTFPAAPMTRGVIMSSSLYHSSKPDAWVLPRPYQDASLRLRTHGPILPMEEEPQGFWARILGR